MANQQSRADHQVDGGRWRGRWSRRPRHTRQSLPPVSAGSRLQLSLSLPNVMLMLEFGLAMGSLIA